MSERFFVPAMSQEILTDTVLFTDPRCPFKGIIHAGDPRLTIIVGDNASGKSLLFRALAERCRDNSVLPVTVSIRERTGSGLSDISGMRRALMFGDETESSTGATSAHVVKVGFRSAKKEGGAALLMLDEPELGLSESYAGALGDYIGQVVRGPFGDDVMHETCGGVVVVTHSRPLIQGILSGLRTSPTFINMGGSQDLSDWLAKPKIYTAHDLEKLGAAATAGRRLVNEILKERRARP
ncbi:P-loop containing nucleoside triphosphate hydrolase [Brevundimonas phage vB_BpoS-Kikimora]|uniref:P-loop containing nucleoside triphosphate hydrolase n=1 Tax=Brevundimonas phage vB_BpoS-Kikimora TaxID=2948601 RepID=A0A9E7SLB1_9CAUD|nr:P-loop containing nucleoside triphosphate hydrolase [Brevundimonas phage vB_BpoS-Kikimora]